MDLVTLFMVESAVDIDDSVLKEAFGNGSLQKEARDFFVH